MRNSLRYDSRWQHVLAMQPRNLFSSGDYVKVDEFGVGQARVRYCDQRGEQALFGDREPTCKAVLTSAQSNRRCELLKLRLARIGGVTNQVVPQIVRNSSTVRVRSAKGWCSTRLLASMASTWLPEEKTQSHTDGRFSPRWSFCCSSFS